MGDLCTYGFRQLISGMLKKITTIITELIPKPILSLIHKFQNHFRVRKSIDYFESGFWKMMVNFGIGFSSTHPLKTIQNIRISINTRNPNHPLLIPTGFVEILKEKKSFHEFKMNEKVYFFLFIFQPFDII